MSYTIMDYGDFSRTLNRIVFGNSKQDLLEKIAKNPHRYVGLFRPTRPETKIIQNILQSNEIRFGDALEKLFEQYFIIKGFEILSKKIVNDNDDELNLDHFMLKNGKYYFIEQKVRDDHDSSKKRGQVSNFERKLEMLVKQYKITDILCYFYFVDPDLIKNKKFYKNEIELISQDYGVLCKLCYGNELFDELGISDVWIEILEYLRNWRNNLPTIPEINFDQNSKESFDIMKNINPSIYRKLFNNSVIIKELFPIIFPEKTVLNLLQGFFNNSYKETNSQIYQTLSTCIDKIDY